MKLLLLAALTAATPLLAAPAKAGAGPLLGASLSTGPNGLTISAPMQVVVLLTFLTLLPALSCV